jgi:biopolymer transport protein ExbB/biopolymer transport protein TolQ
MTISAQDRERISVAIHAAEEKTSGEIVCVLAHTSSDTTALPVFLAAAAALALPWLLVAWTAMTVQRMLSLQMLAFLVLLIVLCLPRVRVWLMPRKARRAVAHRVAMEQFVARGIARKRERSGILIFVSLAERYARIIADERISARVPQSEWQAAVDALVAHMRDGRIDEAIKVAERNKKSHLAKVVTAGLMEFKAHQDSPGAIPGETIEASKRALERTEAIVHAELKRGLGGLATIGSTAPFVGLFGTVMGILNAFIGINNSKATGLAAVAGGIAEALVTTAIGLLVAIPAVMMFNYLTGRVEAFDVEMDNSSSELIDYFLKRRGMRRP